MIRSFVKEIIHGNKKVKFRMCTQVIATDVHA